MRKRRRGENGFYPRDIEGFFGSIQDIRIPRTREGAFKPFFIRLYRNVQYYIKHSVIAMYQEDCSTRNVTTTMVMVSSHTPMLPGKSCSLLPLRRTSGHKRRLIRNWDKISVKLQSIRMARHGSNAMVDALCLTYN